MPSREESSTWVSLRCLRSSRILRPTNWICRVFAGAAMVTNLSLLCQDGKILRPAETAVNGSGKPAALTGASALTEALLEDLVRLGEIEAVGEAKLPRLGP